MSEATAHVKPTRSAMPIYKMIAFDPDENNDDIRRYCRRCICVDAEIDCSRSECGIVPRRM